MEYIKKLHYLNYFENGNKGKALGHLVWQEYQGKCELFISLSKLEPVFMGQASVWLILANSCRNIGTLDIKSGHAEKEIYIGSLEDTPIGVRILLTSDKWLETVWGEETKKEELLNAYPVCHPFGDDEEYYSVEIDAIREIKDKYHLENNSFLLHGYYNYRHLIMKKSKDGHYSIGVPGVYYEREKKVAGMYGFDSFRGVKKSEGIGCFGYYMKTFL